MEVKFICSELHRSQVHHLMRFDTHNTSRSGIFPGPESSLVPFYIVSNPLGSRCSNFNHYGLDSLFLNIIQVNCTLYTLLGRALLLSIVSLVLNFNLGTLNRIHPTTFILGLRGGRKGGLWLLSECGLRSQERRQHYVEWKPIKKCVCVVHMYVSAFMHVCVRMCVLFYSLQG